jgi:hypothetical protein
VKRSVKGLAIFSGLVWAVLAGMNSLARAADAASPSTISMTRARRIALKACPGKIESAEQETEKGRLVYSFDIRHQGQTSIDEVLVDARTGEIVSHTTETPSDQAAEKKADQAGGSAH